jgi:tetratricopeptide (TPR) repeat protein/tRNA A-37 threonylcarbamoyl transferase component Bud32
VSDTDDALLEQLLARALELHEQGQHVDVAGLCVEHPHLAASVAAALARVPQLAALHRDTQQADAFVGRLLAGRYRLDERIGAGAMGVVYRAFDTTLARDVAVKVLRPELVVGERMDARLAREGQVLAAIRHGNVVTVFDRGKADDGRNFLVMELLRGQNASSLLRRVATAGAPNTGAARASELQRALGSPAASADSDVRQVVRWVVAAADGLHAAHQSGVVHRDVKPSNLFVERSGRVVLVDFGIVSTDSHGTLGGDGSPFGTPAYMAPEQLQAQAEPDVRSDVYGLAATLYHLLTGRPPFEGSERQVLAAIPSREPLSVERARPGLPVDLAAIVEKGMAKDPARRYPSAQALRADLEAWLEYRPISARRASRWTSAWRRARRSQSVRAAAGALLVAALAVGGWQWSIARAHARTERARELWAVVPSSLVNDLPEYRKGSALRRSTAIPALLDELVTVDGTGTGLALRAIHRADGGDLAAAAADLEELAASGDAPFAAAAAAAYRRGEIPDAMAQREDAPVTGGAGDRFCAVLHAMRSPGAPPPWVEPLLERDGALDRLPGFGELHLLLQLCRAVDARDSDAIEQVARAARRLQALLGRDSAICHLALMNEALWRFATSEGLALGERAQQLAPEDFPLFVVSGRLALQANDWERAAAMLERAVALQPGSLHASSGLCRALVGAGRFAEAEALLDGEVFAATNDARIERDILHGLSLYHRALLTRAAVSETGAGTEPAPSDWRPFAEQARAWFGRAREAIGDGTPTSLEELLCEAMLGGTFSAAQALDLLADSPLDADRLRQIAPQLPPSLGGDDVRALIRLLLRQAEALGARTR